MATNYKRCRVLVVDDEIAMREVLQARLDDWGFLVEVAGSVAEAGLAIERFCPDLIVSDLVLPDGTGIDLLQTYHNERRRFVLITAYGTVDTAVRAMKGGAAEFLTKPLDYLVLRALLDSQEATLRASEPPPTTDTHEHSDELLVGSSQSIRQVRSKVAAVGPSITTVMVVGESGTGKDLVARSIHANSRRRDRPFIAINAAAIPAALVEAELFGHERGAFTGADTTRAGLFEQAHGGTLFLDEVTEMPQAIQPKLLRVLEEGCVRRLGGSSPIAFDVRLIAATNRSPTEAVESGLLRADLFHRLCVFRIDVPPLRERRADIEELSNHLLGILASRDGNRRRHLSEGALSKLKNHGYPGNVRELRNLLERALVFASADRIESDHIELAAEPVRVGEWTATNTHGITLPAGVTAADAERILIVETLKRSGNNKAEAARRLGLDVKTIRNKLKSFEREM